MFPTSRILRKVYEIRQIDYHQIPECFQSQSNPLYLQNESVIELFTNSNTNVNLPNPTLKILLRTTILSLFPYKYLNPKVYVDRRVVNS